VPTIRLGIELGEQSVIDMARKFGLTSPIPAYPSIFIGAAEVYPIELVAAYSAFATLGTRAEPMAITRVDDASGHTIWEPQPVRVPVMSPEEAWLMVSIMKDVVQRGTAASSVGSVFHLPAGGKTGTTNDGTDAWFIGYTSDLVAGVWMGFDKPQKIKSNAQGGILAAPAWSAFMKEAYRRKPAPPDWPMPADIVTRTIDISTNMLATQFCPANLVTNEFYIPGTDPVQPCNVHTGYGTDTTGYGGYPGAYPPASPPPSSAYPPASYPPSTYPPATRTPTPPNPATRRPRDTSLFAIPPRTRPRADTSHLAFPRRDTLPPPRVDSSARPMPADSVRRVHRAP
jgi:penicillin-binding protein 1A